MNKMLFTTPRSTLLPSKAGFEKKHFLLFLFLCAGLLFPTRNLYAQTTTITTESGTDYDGANSEIGNTAVTFVIQNTNTYDITLTGVDMYWASSFSGTIPTLWYAATSLSGVPFITPPGWTRVATGAPVTIPTNGYYPALTNLNFNIPANTQYRFALQSSLGLNYSGLALSIASMPPPAPSSFTIGGVTLKVYEEKISGLNVGYAGSFPNPIITPAAFTGRIKFQATIPCTGPPAAGQAISSAATVCPNKYFVLSHSTTGGSMGLLYQWQSSPDGLAWSNITGATSPYHNALQATTTHYRVQVTCSGQTTPSASVLVNTTAVPISGTFTIDKGNPASATNFPSFAAAIDFIDCGTINGPVVFNVVSGSGPYNEQVVIPVIGGTNATNTITFNGNGNTLINPNTTGDVLKLDGADYIRFNNLTIQTAPTATVGAVVALVNTADNNIFTGCTLNHSITTASTSYGAYIVASSRFNTFQNNTISGGYFGIYNYGTTTVPVTNNQFKNNLMKDQYYYGIANTYATNTLIEGNDISRPTRTNGDFMYGIFAGAGSTGLSISKNRIHNTHDAATTTTGTVYGVYIQSAAGTVAAPNMVSNNAVYNINNNGGSLHAFYNSGGNNTHYYYNTVSADMPGITYNTIRGMNFLSASTNVRFINNNISLSNYAISKHGIYLTSATIALQSNNNNLYVPNGNIGFHTTDHATLVNWKAANSGAYDQASVSANPQFADLVTGVLRPTNSSLNDMGQVVAAITDDITGAIRSTTAPDPGAFEFTPLLTDAGMEAVISPVSPVTPGTSTPVQVSIKNFGSNILTAATLGFSVNGTTVVNNFAFTGNLALNSVSSPITIGNYTFPAGSYDLCVWVTAPNGLADGNTKNDTTCVTIYSCAPMAGNYTINAGAPVSASNFQSVTNAVNTLNSCGISAPVTFTVAIGSGPYPEQIYLTSISGSSAANTITFEGNGNTISASPTMARSGVVTLDGADHVTINNFIIELDATATSGWGVQLMRGADNNTISNCTINLPLTSISNNVNGIVAGLTPTLLGNNTSNSRFMNNTINGGYYGIILNGNTGSLNALNNQITGNTIQDTYMYNIYLNNTDGTLVENNDFSRPTRTTVSTFYGVYLTSAKTTTISRNRIHNTHGAATALTGGVYGIYHNNSDSPVGSESVVKNNLIYDITNTGLTYAIYNGGSDGVHYFHNTIDLSNTANTGTVRAFFQTTLATNLKLQNNIITLDGGASGVKHALYFGTATSAITSSHNVLHVTNNARVGYLGGDFATLALWQAAGTGAYDQNSVAADPIYLNLATGNLRPTSVAVNNIGTPLAAVTDDILGSVRSTTTPDPGAYEFTINPNEVGITAITGPVTGCNLTASEVITVTIRNFGTSTQTAIPVTLMVNAVNLTPTPETWTGSLAPNTTATHTFAATANLSTAGTYQIIAATNLTGDSDNSNNADTLTVTNSLMAGLPVIDFETAATGLTAIRTVKNAKSGISENTAASLPFSGQPATSTKGMLMEGTNITGWVMPVGITDPWTNNPDHFSAAYLCFSPAGGPVGAPLWLAFDLKQVFKTANANTNFRVTINGTPVGGNTTGAPANTYRPTFTGVGGTADWTKIYIDLTPYKNLQMIEIGLESSVAEPFANGTGPANLVDNIRVVRADLTGNKDQVLQSTISVYPNPSTGVFAVSVPDSKLYTLEVTDLTGKVIRTIKAKGNTQLDLKGNSQGVYMLRITSEGATAIQKLIVL